MIRQHMALRAASVLLSLICSLTFAAVGSAATTYNGGGSLTTAGNWSNGLPAAGNVGTTSVSDTFAATFSHGYGAGSVVNQTAGHLDFGANSFHLLSGEWNTSGGSMTANGQWTPNGASTAIHLSGGSVTSTGVVTGPLNGALITVSGSADVHFGGFYHGVGGTIDFLPDWTGSFTVDNYTAPLWETLFTTGNNGGNFDGTFNGAMIDSATFNSTFQVSDDGTTLSAIPSAVVPEPLPIYVWCFLGLMAVGFMWSRKRRRS